MTDTSAPPPLPVPVDLPPMAADLQADELPAVWVKWAVLILSLATAGAGWLAWSAQQKVQTLEQELVRRQQDSQNQAMEARVLARQAQEASREASARVALLDTRLSDVAMQRTQIDDLIKNLSLSRDENLLADIEAGLHVASQQATLTGSAEPIVAALQSADARLSRAHLPRLDNIRRAVAKDLDRIRGTRVADTGAMTARLDEAARLVDELPLLNQPDDDAAAPPVASGGKRAKGKAVTPPSAAGGDATADGQAMAASAALPGQWGTHVLDWTRGAARTVWHETRSLIRLTRINRPEGMLISPDQAFFLRENLKLRLLNARLALLSRQNAVALTDLRTIEATVPRYFDLQSRKTQLLQSMLADVAAQSRLTTVPRPDDTLAALAGATGGR